MLSAGDAAAALQPLSRAVAGAPGNPEYLNSLGNAHRALARPEDAIASYRGALASDPGYLPSLYNLGVLLQDSGALQEAERCFRQITEADASDADALFRLGSVLGGLGRLADAASAYRQALRLQPDNPYLWLYLGQAEDSIECYLKSLALKPDLAQAHLQLGLAHKKHGRLRAALASMRETLRIEPGMAQAHDSLGNLLQDMGRLREAIEHHREAVRLAPDSALHHNNLGCALVRQGALAEALACLRRATALQPESADAYLNLGNAASLLGERDEALECYRTALRLQPDNGPARDALLFEMQKVCDWSRFAELCEAQRAAVRHGADFVTPFSFLSIPSTREEQLQCARAFAERHARRAPDLAPFAFVRRGTENKLTIGYLSADLHEHATAYLMAELFELHDRSRFRVVAYSYGVNDRSTMRARLVRAFERFVDVAALSHADAATAIHDDGVDILVDLKGYTQGARSEILALRPAPVQASYIGYPGTMGASFIDYLIADRFVIPAEHASGYSERLVLMPGSYQVNDRKRPAAAPPERAALGLPQQGFVYCCFNQSYKILPEVFAAWMRVLSAVPGSVLWLLEDNRRATENLRREASARGIAADRLVFAPRVPLERHLARVGAADLVLDTLPYNAHTTASDALWACVPVLTCPGQTMASRVAGSLLSAVGLPELIAASMADYEALAISLARDPTRLTALRRRLTQGRASASLFDTPAFVRALESAYERMWQIHAAGLAPQHIDLSTPA